MPTQLNSTPQLLNSSIYILFYFFYNLQEGRQYAVSRGMSYFETSANSGQNVSEMFDFLFKAIVRTTSSTS